MQPLEVRWAVIAACDDHGPSAAAQTAASAGPPAKAKAPTVARLGIHARGGLRGGDALNDLLVARGARLVAFG